MVTAVFFVHDGAAILVLANCTGGLAVVETISMYLTMIRGITYLGCMLYDIARGGILVETEWWFVVFSWSFGLCGVVFQSYILITKVLLSKDDDAPLSGGLEINAFVVYGITALLYGWGMTSFAFHNN